VQNQKIYGELIDTGWEIEIIPLNNKIYIVPVNYTSTEIKQFDPQYEGWAIADTDGNLYLASNRKNFYNIAIYFKR
jgi:hypothetical protein